MAITTDLNQRERAKFAEMARAVSKHAATLADAIEADDDTKLMIEFMIFSIAASSLNELQEILIASLEVVKDKPKPDGFLTPEESAALL